MRIERFHFYLLDQYDNPKLTGIGDTNELFNVLEADMSYTSLGRLKASLTLKIKESKNLNIDYMNDRVQVKIEIDGALYSKGTYLISTSARNVNNGISTRFLTCYSKLKILDNDKILSAYYLPKGASVHTAIITLIGDNKCNIPVSEAKLNKDYTATIGTPKLDIINELLEIINYNSLVVDDEGFFVSRPYVLPADRETEQYYLEGNPQMGDDKNVCRLISPIFEEDLDMFDVPNIFLRYTNDVEIDPPIVAVYPLQGDGNTPITLDGRAPNVSSEEVSDIADYATLYAKCKKDAAEARSIYSHIEIETAINPNHGYLTCVEVQVENINYKYIETSWSMKLKAGALMKHKLRRVVNLDD